MSVAVASSPSMGSRLRSGWFWLVLAFGLVLLIVLTSRPESTAPFSPDSNRPSGTKALATVLEDHGVEIIRVHSASRLKEFNESSDAVQRGLVMDAPKSMSIDDALPEEAWDRFGTVTLVGFSSYELDQLGYPVKGAYATSELPLGRVCTEPSAGNAAQLTHQSSLYRLAEGEEEDWTGCFGTRNGWGLLTISDGHQRHNLVADPDWFTNAEIAKQDNAAFALSVLGDRRQLVWYEPQVGDASELMQWDDGTMDALPSWSKHVLNLLCWAAVVTMLWRGRRLGRLVSEPLPVEVRSLETTLNRGRLYRRAADTVHAGGLLQRATTHRLAARLGMASDDIRSLSVRLAEAYPVGDAATVEMLLTRPAGTPDELVWLAGQLQQLENTISENHVRRDERPRHD